MSGDGTVGSLAEGPILGTGRAAGVGTGSVGVGGEMIPVRIIVESARTPSTIETVVRHLMPETVLPLLTSATEAIRTANGIVQD